MTETNTDKRMVMACLRINYVFIVATVLLGIAITCMYGMTGGILFGMVFTTMTPVCMIKLIKTNHVVWYMAAGFAYMIYFTGTLAVGVTAIRGAMMWSIVIINAFNAATYLLLAFKPESRLV